MQHKEILATIEHILLGQKTPMEQDTTNTNSKHNHKRKLDIQEEDSEETTEMKETNPNQYEESNVKLRRKITTSEDTIHKLEELIAEQELTIANNTRARKKNSNKNE